MSRLKASYWPPFSTECLLGLNGKDDTHRSLGRNLFEDDLGAFARSLPERAARLQTMDHQAGWENMCIYIYYIHM